MQITLLNILSTRNKRHRSDRKKGVSIDLCYFEIDEVRPDVLQETTQQIQKNEPNDKENGATEQASTYISMSLCKYCTSIALDRNSWTPSNLKIAKPEGDSNSNEIMPPFPSSPTASTEVKKTGSGLPRET